MFREKCYKVLHPFAFEKGGVFLDFKLPEKAGSGKQTNKSKHLRALHMSFQPPETERECPSPKVLKNIMLLSMLIEKP